MTRHPERQRTQWAAEVSAVLVGLISMIVLHSCGGDSDPSGSTAETAIRCLPTANSNCGLVAVIPFITPCAPFGTGAKNRKYGLWLEMSYTLNFATQCIFTAAEQAGVFVKS